MTFQTVRSRLRRESSRTPGFAGLVLLLATLALSWIGPTIETREVDSLAPGRPVECELAAGETHIYRAALTAGSIWRVSVEQLGIDVELTLVPPQGERVVTDSPLDRAGTEALVVRADAAGSFQVEVHGRERAAPPGRYRIFLETLAGDTAQDRKRLAAETARMQAARYYAQGVSGYPGALKHYRQAAVHWHALGADREETRELYCLAVLQRLVDETRTALESAREVLPRWQRLGDQTWEAATLNEIGWLLWSMGESRDAKAFLDRALSLRQALGDSFGVATTRNNVCLTYLGQGQLREGLACYEPLLPGLSDSGEKQLASVVHTNIGWIYDTLGEPDSAVEQYQQALALARALGDRKQEAQTLNNLARLHRRFGEPERALTEYEQALELFRRLQDLRWQGRVLNNIGYTYAALGEPQQALALFRQSLALRQQVGDRRGEVFTLTSLGYVFRHLGQRENALSSYQKALALAAKIDDPRLEAMALTGTGWAYLQMANGRRAIDYGTRALEILETLQTPAAEADALHLIGRALSLEGDSRNAVPRLERALSLLRGMRDQANKAGPLVALARAERDLGRLGRARSHVEAALESTELLRTRVGTADLRALFQSSRRETYELNIDVLMALHRAAPGAEHDLEALTASELSRARVLLDLLNEARADIHQGVDAALIERSRFLGRQLNAKAARRSAVLAGEPTPEEEQEVESELSSALYDLDRVEAEIRRRSPRYAALTQPQPLTAREIQGLLDADTLLLEYALGEERSFLWLVSSHRIESFELPASQEVEDAARRFHQLLSQPGAMDRRTQAVVASTLSDMLLAPVADHLDAKRLAVVADGALHYLPFGTLPVSATDVTPLLLRHEVVYLPSASVLAEQRRRVGARSPPSGWLAVLADPVYEIQDPRLEATEIADLPAPPGASAERGGRQPGLADWKRLPGSRREAEAILALAPPEQSFAALGFEASRATALGVDIGRHRVVHFATHGLIDTGNPRLSGLVLSLFDEYGRSYDGFLRAHDVFNLDLAADLVVLSGCQTALGKEVRGEGLLGLTRGFMYAGASRVVASLWRVEDRATAELMSRFYRSIWDEGKAPAAALREAQLSISRERRWKDPYYWASFVLQGEWRQVPHSQDDRIK